MIGELVFLQFWGFVSKAMRSLRKVIGKLCALGTWDIAQTLALKLKPELSSKLTEVFHLYNFKLHHLGVIESLFSPAPLLLVKLNLLIRAH